MTPDCDRYTVIIPTPLPGAHRLGVIMDTLGVTQMEFLPGCAPLCHGATPLERRIEQQLTRYFQNSATPVDIPLHPAGTAYQQRVWQALIKIPVGATIRYGELAAKLASGPRAIAGACRTNPIPILIPCHRVVAKAGLGGYMGETEGEALSIKQWLLQHEGAI